MINTFLDPAQLPSRTQDQKTFDILMGQLVQLLPTWGNEINGALGQFNAGLAGGAYALPYVFDSGTADADPGPGRLRLSSAMQNAATVMRLDVLAGGQDVTSILDQFDASTSDVKGSIRLVKVGDLSKWLTFNVISRSAPSGYRNLTVVNTGGSSASPFAAGDGVLLFFQRNGDRGTTGSVSSFPTLIVRDERPVGTNGGSSTYGVQTRVLNTVVKNTISGASLSANGITLPAGTYKVTGSAPARGLDSGTGSNPHKAFLADTTSSWTVILIGTSEVGYGAGGVSRSLLDGQIVLPSEKTLYLFHAVANAISTNGLGIPTAASYLAMGEVYSQLTIEKIA